MSTLPSGLVNKKVFEIAYALVRVSQNLKRDHGFLSQMLEEQGIQVLNLGISGRFSDLATYLNQPEWLLHLSSEAGFLAHVNTEVVIREIHNLRSELHGSDEGSLPDLKLEQIFSSSAMEFSSMPVSAPVQEAVSYSGSHIDMPATIPDVVDRPPVQHRQYSPRTSGGFLDRQSAILRILNSEISQFPQGFRMRDFQTRFPAVSERTLRYDLEKLVQQGLIQRVGKGPASSYRPVTSEIGV